MNELQKMTDNYLVRDRSNFQLEHFVIGQHDTPEMQFRQIVIEAKALHDRIEDAKLEIEIQKKKIAKLESSSDDVDHLKAKRKKRHMQNILSAIAASQEELDFLIHLSRRYKFYSASEIEEKQKDYWEKRLTRQAVTDRMSIEHKVDVGNLQSLLQAGIIKQQELTS